MHPPRKTPTALIWLRHGPMLCEVFLCRIKGFKKMTTSNFHQVFPSFAAIHVGSDADVVQIQQGDLIITLPAALVPDLIEALRLAHQGDL